jgi:hypothetical protein
VFTGTCCHRQLFNAHGRRLSGLFHSRADLFRLRCCRCWHARQTATPCRDFAVATQHKKWRSGSRQAIRRSSSAVLADSSYFAGYYLGNARNMIDRLAENRLHSGGKPNENRKDEHPTSMLAGQRFEKSLTYRFSTVSLGRFAVGCRSRSK